jgi:hypothetical protein
MRDSSVDAALPFIVERSTARGLNCFTEECCDQNVGIRDSADHAASRRA